MAIFAGGNLAWSQNQIFWPTFLPDSTCSSHEHTVKRKFICVSLAWYILSSGFALTHSFPQAFDTTTALNISVDNEMYSNK